MSVTTDSSQARLERTRELAHPNCVVCGPSSANGLSVDFEVLPDGSVEGRFRCGEAFEGYPDYLHGGVIASLLDGAMTNCLFAHGHTALTGELSVRYRHLIATSLPVTVRGWIERSSSRLHVLRARVVQAGQVKATATGKFMDKLMQAYQGHTINGKTTAHYDTG